MTHEHRRGEWLITDEPGLLDPDRIHELVRDTHWGHTTTREGFARGVPNSVAYGLYRDGTMYGFGRAITDRATFAYLSDVVVDESERGHGLGTWLVECILADPALQGLRRIALLTRDAADLYQRLGFHVGPTSSRLVYMERVPGTPQ